jgi:hypothetical protein
MTETGDIFILTFLLLFAANRQSAKEKQLSGKQANEKMRSPEYKSMRVYN